MTDTSTPIPTSSAEPAGSDSLRALYADWTEIITTTPDLTTRLFRSVFDEWHQATREPEDVTYAEETIGGVPGIWTLPLGADRTRVLLYTHGGGFAVGSASSHRKLAGHVAKALGVTAFVLDYRRAPEHPHPAQVEDGVAAFLALVERGIRPEDITTIGDSAGGNLAIAVPLALRDQGQALPGRVIAFSPWLDMENTGESLVSNAATDALVTVPLLESMIAGVLAEGRIHPRTPLANPLHADLTGLPPLYLNAGDAETLRDDAVRFAAVAEAAGADVTLSVVDDMQHVFPFMAGVAPEADDEIAAIAAWYRRRNS
ncbi:acetyl esterase/lipase [Actinomycetospora succinea]|uniref:Acetyl esterase/lipase n=1 Tax=Actinomycetospora succinea TaxID=663603 RepID=A0A4R6VM96_9PSEU|nr:alpha/beta hydrolase [Actinomycetospora succinea]TDQ65053.1 acetyl esterase/lipase [Actinomycetospora succinea]